VCALFLAAVASAVPRGRGRGRQAQRSSRAPGQRSRWPGPIANEEDFLEAKFLYQPWPRAPRNSRASASRYWNTCGPLATLDAQRLRRDPAILGSEDDFDRLYDSLHDALELFPRPCSGSPKPGWSDRERSLLGTAARLVVGAYSPRGNELPVATGLFVLQTLERRTRNGWRASSRFWLGWTLRRRFPWARPDLALSRRSRHSRWCRSHLAQPRRGGARARLASETPAAAHPHVAPTARHGSRRSQHAERIVARQRVALGHGHQRERAVPSLRQISRAAETAARSSTNLATIRLPQAPRRRQPFWRPACRQPWRWPVAFFPAVSCCSALQRSGRSGGCGRDPAPWAHPFPSDSEMLLLASRVARFCTGTLSGPALPRRDAGRAGTAERRADKIADLVGERMELALLRLKARIDPERMPPVLREAEILRSQLAPKTSSDLAASTSR